jgi:FkbM family methyltransferase
MNKICVLGDSLCFNISGDLERYRVESIFEKEPETIAWIDSWKASEQEKVFYDIGANIGIYSLYAAQTAKKTNIFSFEPVSNNYLALQSNLWLNQATNVYPFNIALSKENKIKNLYLSDLRVGNSGAQIDAPLDEKGGAYHPQKVEKVLSLSVDQLIKNFDLPTPNYIKIDVDGHESDILNGMTDTLKNSELQSILIEFNNQIECEYWGDMFFECGLVIDHALDGLPNHSGIRRQLKGSPVRNYIFKRI